MTATTAKVKSEDRYKRGTTLGLIAAARLSSKYGIPATTGPRGRAAALSATESRFKGWQARDGKTDTKAPVWRNGARIAPPMAIKAGGE